MTGDDLAGAVLRFWEIEIGPGKWYKKNPADDQEIRRRFEGLWVQASQGKRDHWQETADGALALILVLDQFPRNMFRGCARAFSTDARALAVARTMIACGHDLEIAGALRQFCYMPFMHAENLDDQETSVRLTSECLSSESSQYHARKHRELIARFGRFPHRNAALGRAMTAAEQAYLDSDGYRA